MLEEPLLVALPAWHALAGEETITLAALAGAPLISFPKHLVPGAHDHLMDLFAQGGYTPNIVQEAVHLQTIVSLVASGIGVSSCPPRRGVRRWQGWSTGRSSMSTPPG